MQLRPKLQSMTTPPLLQLSPRQVTLTVAIFGRGSNFMCYDEKLEERGVCCRRRRKTHHAHKRLGSGLMRDKRGHEIRRTTPKSRKGRKCHSLAPLVALLGTQSHLLFRSPASPTLPCPGCIAGKRTGTVKRRGEAPETENGEDKVKK